MLSLQKLTKVAAALIAMIGRSAADEELELWKQWLVTAQQTPMSEIPAVWYDSREEGEGLQFEDLPLQSQPKNGASSKNRPRVLSPLGIKQMLVESEVTHTAEFVNRIEQIIELKWCIFQRKINGNPEDPLPTLRAALEKLQSGRQEMQKIIEHAKFICRKMDDYDFHASRSGIEKLEEYFESIKNSLKAEAQIAKEHNKFLLMNELYRILGVVESLYSGYDEYRHQTELIIYNDYAPSTSGWSSYSSASSGVADAEMKSFASDGSDECPSRAVSIALSEASISLLQSGASISLRSQGVIIARNSPKAVLSERERTIVQRWKTMKVQSGPTRDSTNLLSEDVELRSYNLTENSQKTKTLRNQHIVRMVSFREVDRILHKLNHASSLSNEEKRALKEEALAIIRSEKAKIAKLESQRDALVADCETKGKDLRRRKLKHAFMKLDMKVKTDEFFDSTLFALYQEASAHYTSINQDTPSTPDLEKLLELFENMFTRTRNAKNTIFVRVSIEDAMKATYARMYPNKAPEAVKAAIDTRIQVLMLRN